MSLINLPPNPDATCEENPLVRTAKFGDGYEQIMPQRLNLPPKIWTANFGCRTFTEQDQLITILKQAYASTPVNWKSPLDQSPRPYLVTNWRRTALAGKLFNVEVTLEEWLG